VNWVEALAMIDCSMMKVAMPLEEMDKVFKPSITRSVDEVPQPKTAEEMLNGFQMDEIKEEVV